MTILYKPVLIESAEQAEALPEGAFVPRANGRLPKKRKDGTWGDLWGDCGLFDILTWTAYVPIEAEEETIRKTGYVTEDGYLVHSRFGDDPVHVATKTYFMSPWEEA